MNEQPLIPPESTPLASWSQAIRQRTPARLLVGRAGSAYRTGTQLELRQDHAAALDAVHAELDLKRDLGADLIEKQKLFIVSTCASSKTEYLARPDLGRRLSAEAAGEIGKKCVRSPDLQVVVGDGLSATAVARQVPSLLPLLRRGAAERGWTWGQPFVLRYCRVGVLNEMGALLDPAVVVLLIGERPGLATAESLSAYLAYRPRPDHSDAQRNLISNIHGRGVPVREAAARILALAELMRRLGVSGVTVKEEAAAPARLEQA